MVQDQLCSVANTVRNKKDLSTLLLAAVIAPPAFLATKVNAPGGARRCASTTGITGTSTTGTTAKTALTGAFFLKRTR